MIQMKKKTNKAKFQEMNRKQKVEYIWEYYKLHIIFGTLGLIFVGSLLNTWFINPPPKTAVHVVFMGTSISTDAAEVLEKELNPLIVTKEMGNKKVFVSTYYMSPAGTGQPQLDMATQTKFMANISANELDILVLDEAQFKELATTQQTFLPLDQILPEDMLVKLEDKFVRLKGEEDTEDQIYGIDVTDNEKVRSVAVGEGKKIMGVLVNTVRKEETLKTLKWFFGME